MIPTPRSGFRLSHPEKGDEVLITGCAGNFPDSDNVVALRDNLFNKVDLISDDDRRWKLAHPEIPQRVGKINNVNKFDASFFGVHFKQAHTMDPMCRILLEKTYEAVLDAGVNPKLLKGTKTGVFIGACFSESEKTWFYEKMQVNGFGITGCSRAMLANRISYWLGCTGPSYSVDSACSSSLYALEHAYRAIRDGHCEAAIVGGSNLCLHPYVSLQFSRLGVLSPEGRCKSFDKDASGYARSEAIVVVFLQKAKDAKRVYAQVLHAKTNCDGYKEQGITYPAGHVQKMLLKEFYEDCKIDPSSLEFIEAHGTGTRVGDPEELKALDEIFCTGRSDPLLIGAIKSNLGHSEPASGLCSIAKMCIAYDTGYLPPNLHYESPREGVAALAEGRMKVVTEKTPWNRGMTGVNSFGFGGANAHVLLKHFALDKVNDGKPKDDLPRLVCVSGRTESAISRLLDDVESRPVDVEHVRLLQSIHEIDISGHVFRGYSLLRTKGDVMRASRDAQYFPGVKRPLWFVFSGMGSQWSGMGAQLMRIPIFSAAIEKCHQALRPKGIDITGIITNPDPRVFDNILHSFVGIAAIQIGLCDILKALGIEPDNIIGHSVGELGCAYADGCFTREQMILAAYCRGLASIETPFIKGSMAAVGLGYGEVKNLCPSDIEVACHNGPDSSTISGPADSMKAFVAKLQSQGVFAKEVPCSNIAYHSRYIAEAGPTLLKYLKQVIPKPTLRSSKWVSSSVPQHLWNDTEALYSSAEYHTNNLLSPVLFEETSKLIQGNAITIEIAPHGLLQAILRRSLKKDCTNVALTKRGHPDNVEFLLSSIGKLYEVGLNLQLANIYPKIEFPVSSGTPMISHLVEWEHSEDWYVTSYRAQEKMKSGERTVRMTIADEDMDYMAGHVVDGRNLYPATGYLVLVWETLGMMMGELYAEVSVVFENVRFQRATNIPKEGNLEFTIMVQKGSGNFEIVEGGAAIVTGKIYAKKDVSQEYRPFPDPPEETGPHVRTLTSKDVYKEFRLRGYGYSGLFRGVQSCNIEGNRGNLSWVNNWITFMDTMLQMKILGLDTRALYVPTRIEKLSIDTTKHYAILSAIPEGGVKSLPVVVYEDVDVIRSGGVEIRGLNATPITRRNPLGIPVLEKYEFLANVPNYEMTMDDAVRSNIQLALENIQNIKVKAIEILDNGTDANSTPLIPIVSNALGDIPLIQAELLVISEEKLDLGPNITVESKKLSGETNALIVIGSKLLERRDVLQQAIGCLKSKGFILSRESLSVNFDNCENLDIITAFKVDNEVLVYIRNKVASKPAKFLHIKEADFQWIEQVKDTIKESDKLVLINQNEPLSGILGLTNCLRKEPGGEIISCFWIVDPKAPPFDPYLPFYEDQLDKDLAINIFKDGKWGTYRHLQLEDNLSIPVEHAYVNVLTRGDLSSLKWVEGPLRCQDQKNIVHVYYTALNFRDIMTSTGRISVETVARGRLAQECVQGLEYAGKTISGARVMGMVENRGLSNVVAGDAYLLWPVPDAWTLQEAATVPVTYGTVYYAMFMIGKMKPKETVLIHAGSGGVGQAAINVCLHYGCKVFTTVGTPEKRAFIKKLFPQLTDNCIGNSRDTSFEELIMRETDGKGVDIVLNSLSEDKLLASVRCLGHGGRFLEIGKFDIVNNTSLGMYIFLKEASFHGVMMDLFASHAEVRKEVSELVFDGLKKGCVKPLCSVVFEKDELEKCFRYMAAGKHIGKVLLKIRSEETDLKALPVPMKLNAIPRYICYQELVYIIVGGLGGFGLELADWLILQGAKKVVLNSRKGISNGYQSSRIRAWRSYGVDVVINTEDVTTQEGCRKLLKVANSMGTVQAIFNLAVVLKDALLENQNAQSYVESFGPKAVATKYLDIESRKLCPKLGNFVVFSSVSCGRGNAGQSNYGMCNAIMERICEKRKQDGLPALAVQWGAVGEVGLVADMQDDHCEIEIGGTLQQRISSCLKVLDQFLSSQKHAILGSMVVAEKKAGGAGTGTIVGTVASIMGLKDLKTVSQQVTLAELGMDSMMAVEIKQSLEREFEIFLTAQDIRTLTFTRLQELSVQREAEASTSANNKTFDGLTGLKMLMRNIGDELSASEPIVHMATMVGDGVPTDLVCDVDPLIFMIPGIEGMATVLESMSKRLKCKAIALQLGYDHANESVVQIAERLLLSIRSRLAPGAQFSIMGYSFGVMVALEIARVLEAEGHMGRIFCIDGAPDFLYTLMKSSLNTTQEDTLQNTLLCHIHDVLIPKQQVDLLPLLNECDTFESKLELFLKHVPETIKHSKQYQRALATVVYGRLHAVINYDGSNFTKVKSPTILLRPIDTPPGVVVDENYGLQQYVESPVKVHLLEGNHVTIVDNKDCANIINRAMADWTKDAATKATGQILNMFEASAGTV